MAVRRLALSFVLAALTLAAPAAAATGRISDDPLQSQEWYLAAVGAGAGQASPPGAGVPITIVDSGVDATQPDFAGRPNTNFLNSQTVSGGSEFHGTEVASVAAAPANGIGIVGVYPQAVLDVWDTTPTPGPPQDFLLATAITSARCPGVINLSLGSDNPDPTLEDAVLIAQHKGCLVVAAAGNEATQGDPTIFPAAFPHVLAVAATDQQNRVASFSSFGSWVDLAAPGVGIVVDTTLAHDPDGYETADGTSYSAPIVSAAAAWIWTMRPTLSAAQLFTLLRSTAQDVGAPGRDAQTGYGLLNIPAALAAPTPAPDPQEPNDDVNQVKPGALFHEGQPPLTTAARTTNGISGTLDADKDPRDLYRIWVPAHRVVRASVTSGGNAAARIWGPQTVSVDESLAARRRDLKGPLVRAGAKGFYAYAEVLLTGRSDQASYVLRVTAARR